jgi:hypothetical protein
MITLDFIPKILSDEWQLIETRVDGQSFFNGHRQLSVIYSEAIYDHKRWLQVSCAHRNKLPNWETLKYVKNTFIGEDKTAIQILPAADNFVNLHPYVLHLWHCLDGDVTPDFTRGTKSI